MNAFLLLALLAVIPVDVAIRDRCDVLELNYVWHTTSEEERLEFKPGFTQLLFREWDFETGHHQIVAWKMVKMVPIEEREAWEQDVPYELQRVLRSKPDISVEWVESRQRWVATIQDGEKLRLIEARSYGETHTGHDPEVTERNLGRNRSGEG